MALSENEARDLATLVPDGMRCEDSRQRLLCVLQILLALTDEDHALSNADIRAVLRSKFDGSPVPAENTIAADLRAIRDSGYPGIAIHVTPAGTWCERTEPTPQEVRLLINAVQSSRFLTRTQSYGLMEDLYGLVSRHQDYVLSEQVLVASRVRREDTHVFDTLDVVARALHEGRQIEFTYCRHGFDGRLHPLEGEDGETRRTETPIAILYAAGNYFVETYTPVPWRYQSLTKSRVDRMVDVRLSSRRVDRDRAANDARRSARRRHEQSFSLAGGRERHLFLRVRSWALNRVLDEFGFDLRFDLHEGVDGDREATAVTHIRTTSNATLFRWLAGIGEGAAIVEPPDEVRLLTGKWRKQLRDLSRDRLMEDYRDTVGDYLAFLDRARAPYAPHVDGMGRWRAIGTPE